MNSHNMSDHKELLAYYADRVIKIARGHGVKVITWQDPLDYGVDVSVNREVKISLRQRVRERNFCVLTSSFLVIFLGSYSLGRLRFHYDNGNEY